MAGVSKGRTTDELYDRCLAEGVKARDDWRIVRSDCPYPPNSAAHSAWMDGYDARCDATPTTPVLVDGRDITRPGGVLFNQMPFVSWYPDHRLGPVVALDGDFTLEELRAIVAHIEKHLT